MLAYSSIENMGIIAVGTGIGGLGAYGALICLIHHSLIKSSLFLTSGNILLGFGSRLINDTGGLVARMPKTFVAFLSGFAGIAGFPPFGIFIGEILIIIAAFRSGHYIAVGLFILSLCVILAGLSNNILKIAFGQPQTAGQVEEHVSMVLPQYVLLMTSLVLCFWMPDTLYQTLIHAVKGIGGGF
jgi:hydrogenase-4 component F